MKLLDGHWNTIILFASGIDSEQAERLDMFAQSHDDGEPAREPGEVRAMLPFVEQVIGALEKLGGESPEPGDDDPDAFEATIYADILKAVRSVFAESLRLSEPFQAWLEYT
ncbi:MAG TPA: hypothetical protein VFS21_15290 [Roseiflexaceae bacterium]|nr:hypothetical protein [Roseiflexaceae bacterium]